MSSKAKSSPMESATKWLESHGFKNICATDVESYEEPSNIVRQRDDETFTPMATARKNGSKYYFEVAEKPSKDERERLIQKWTLLAELAEIRNGKFQVFAPYGTFSFTKRVIENHSIDAEIVKI